MAARILAATGITIVLCVAVCSPASAAGQTATQGASPAVNVSATSTGPTTLAGPPWG
jgi:hypothetical protein